MRVTERSDRLVYILWAFGAVGIMLLLHTAWFGPINERDFVAVWVAGKLAAAGQATQAYDVEALRAAGVTISGTTVIKIAYPYPPQALFIAVPLSWLPLWVAYGLWQAVSAALFYIAARPYCPPGFPKFLAILTPAALVNVLFGQVGLFFGALWLFVFSGSAIAAAALTFKPHLGFLVVVEAARRRRILLTSAIALAMLGLSAAAFGLEAWRAWFTGSILHQLGDLTDKPLGVWHYQMVTPYLAYGVIGWGLFASAAIYLLTQRFDVFTAATAAFLIAPYGFHYDLTVVCLGFGLLLFQRWRDMPAWQTLVCGTTFLLPLIVVLGTWIASPLLLLGLYVHTRNPIAGQGDRGDSVEPEEAAAAR